MAAVPEQSLLQNDGSVQGAFTREWVERWLSPERLAPYLANCGGDVELALELYTSGTSHLVRCSYVTYPISRLR